MGVVVFGCLGRSKTVHEQVLPVGQIDMAHGHGGGGGGRWEEEVKKIIEGTKTQE